MFDFAFYFFACSYRHDIMSEPSKRASLFLCLPPGYGRALVVMLCGSLNELTGHQISVGYVVFLAWAQIIRLYQPKQQTNRIFGLAYSLRFICCRIWNLLSAAQAKDDQSNKINPEREKEMPLNMVCYVLYELRFINGHTIKGGSLRFIYECYFICTELIWIRILPVAFDGAKGSV